MPEGREPVLSENAAEAVREAGQGQNEADIRPELEADWDQRYRDTQSGPGEAVIEDLLDRTMGPMGETGREDVQVPETRSVEERLEGQKNSVPEGAESTSINTDVERHTEAEIKTINEYRASVDNAVVEFIKKWRTLKNPNYKKSVKISVAEVTDRAAQDVKQITGVDVTGFDHALSGNALEHIEQRHGEHGENDHTMADDNDIARIGYVLENYDTAELLRYKKSGEPVLSKEYVNADNTPAKTVVFKKKIDGTYYVVEAVPDTKAHQLRVISAYMDKTSKSTDQVLNMPSNGPQLTPEAPHDANTLATSTVPQSAPDVNTEVQDDGLGAANAGFARSDYNTWVENAEQLHPEGEKSVTPAIYSDPDEVTTAEISELEDLYLSKAESVFKRIARRLGLFRSYSNPDVNLSFEFSGKSIHESKNEQIQRGGAASDFGKMLTVLPQIIDGAQEVEAHTDKYIGTIREDPRLKEMHVLLGAFQTADRVIPVQIEIKEFQPTSGQENKLYLTVTMGTEEAGITPIRQHSNGNAVIIGPPASNISVPDLIGAVKDDTGAFLKYIPDEMLSEVQKEAKRKGIGRESAKVEALRAQLEADDTPDVNTEVQDDGLGAANAGFAQSDYNSWVENAEAFHPEGEDAARNASLPTRNIDGAKTSKVGQTVMEAANTPDERVIDIENAYVNGKLTIDTRTNAGLVRDAVAKIAQDPEKALNDWTRDVRDGKVSNELVATGAALLDSERVKSNGALFMDVLTDYVKLCSTAGQALQAQRIYKALSPEGRLYMIKKVAEGLTNDTGRSAGDLRRGRRRGPERQYRRGHGRGAGRRSWTRWRTTRGTTSSTWS